MGTLAGLSEHQHRSPTDEISVFTRKILQSLLDIFTNARPRELRADGTDLPVLSFTDGACERSGVTIGAVIIDTAGLFPPVMWGGHAPKHLVDKWRSGGLEQVIGQAELLPVVLVKHSMAQQLKHRRIIYYVDNDSARQSLTKGYSPSIHSNHIIQTMNSLESLTQSWSWFTRVPSASNPADEPSRLVLIPSASNHFAKVVPMQLQRHQ